jgi:putative ATPase
MSDDMAMFEVDGTPAVPTPGFDVPVRGPLAARMRPRTLDEIVGQSSLVAPESPLRRLLEAPNDGPAAPVSLVLWGPPGTGKTTIAQLVSSTTGRRFVELSAVSSGVKDVREAIDGARRRFARGEGTVLFIDEVHRFSRTQQDALLPGVEAGWITLVAATTENPSTAVVAPLLSRSLVLILEPLTDDEIITLLRRAEVDDRGLGGAVAVTDEARAHLAHTAGGDARRALTALEAAAGIALATDGAKVDVDTAAAAVQRAALRYDRAGDQHYDVASALIKSVRGSDVDAALHYLARMAEAGEDPKFLARRLVISAAEDLGLADPSALTTAVAAAQAVALVGWPEARIILAEAVVALALAPKSNSVYLAIDAAIADVRAGNVGTVPVHLRDGNLGASRKAGHGGGYIYPHDTDAGVAPQQYAPDVVADRQYYVPNTRGAEARYADVWHRVRALLGKDTDD